MARFRLLIADDHELTVAGIRLALEDAAEFEIVGSVTTGAAVLPAVRRLRPDLVLLDLQLPLLDGYACLDLLRVHHPEVRTLVLSGYSDAEHIESSLRRGAIGYIVKTVALADLPVAIRQALNGTLFVPLGARHAADEDAVRLHGLTARELTIISHLADGKSNAAIAAELWIEGRTVKFHLTNIFRKLNVKNRTEVALWARQHGVVQSPRPAETSASR